MKDELICKCGAFAYDHIHNMKNGKCYPLNDKQLIRRLEDEEMSKREVA